MSMDLTAASERVCYLHCNFCNTMLAVSVPCNNSLNMVTVRCGHCANLLSVHMGANLQSSTLPPPPPPPSPLPPPQDPQIHHLSLSTEGSNKNGGSSSSSSKSNKFGLAFQSMELLDQPRISPIRPPEKRQRVPSAYNRFIKEEIQRIKAGNPHISHREAFSTAAKNWAHLPHIHFGLKLDGMAASNQS